MGELADTKPSFIAHEILAHCNRITFMYVAVEVSSSIIMLSATPQANAISVPVEITAAQILITFWDPSVKRVPLYTALICVFVCLINIFGVR